MKKVILALIVVFPLFCFAQTNVFPNNGNVGIGTQSPIWPLTVNGAIALSGDVDQILHLRPSNGHAGYVYWAESGVAERGILGFNAGSGDLIYRSGAYNFSSGTERFRITDAGNVGIGTSSPRSLLTIRAMGTGISFSPGGAPYYGTLAFNRESQTGDIFDNRGYAFQINNGGTDTNLHFQIYRGDGGMITNNALVIGSNGNVGINTPNPTDRFSVNGKIRAHEIKVETANWPDYVFAKDYKLPSLAETEKHIQEKGHLPGIPSAEEVKNNGIDLGEMNAKLLQKIEELTLYLIEKDKTDKDQQLKIDQLQKLVSHLLEKDK
jgi:hypothetical protein